MTEVMPAWSNAFVAPGPGPGPQITGPITAEWAFGDRRGAGVRVAVIDSGIDASHSLVGAVSRAVSFEVDRSTPGGIRVTEAPHDDLYGHGTACAGIIRSLAPDVELVSLRVLGKNLRGSAHSFARALEWCLVNDVEVANLSLSTSNEQHSEMFHQLVDDAVFANLMLVSAMNNERRLTIPSQFSGVFSVACAPGSDREKFWCNPDAPAEWGAAGINVVVPWPNDETVTVTGNSFAAPVIAAHLARLVATHPGITPWQARTILAALAENRP